MSTSDFQKFLQILICACQHADTQNFSISDKCLRKNIVLENDFFPHFWNSRQYALSACWHAQTQKISNEELNCLNSLTCTFSCDKLVCILACTKALQSLSACWHAQTQKISNEELNCLKSLTCTFSCDKRVCILACTKAFHSMTHILF